MPTPEELRKQKALYRPNLGPEIGARIGTKLGTAIKGTGKALPSKVGGLLETVGENMEAYYDPLIPKVEVPAPASPPPTDVSFVPDKVVAGGAAPVSGPVWEGSRITPRVRANVVNQASSIVPINRSKTPVATPDFGYPENVGFVLQGSQGHTSAPGVSEEDIGKFVKASDKHTKWYFDQQGGGGKGTIVPDIIRGDVGDISRANTAMNKMKILTDVDLVKAEEEWDRRVGPTSYESSIRPGMSRAERVAAIQNIGARGAGKDAYLNSLKGADAGDLGSFATSMGNVATNRMQAETAQAKEAGELSLIPSKIALGKAQIGHLGAQTAKERAEAKKTALEAKTTPEKYILEKMAMATAAKAAIDPLTGEMDEDKYNAAYQTALRAAQGKTEPVTRPQSPLIIK